MKILAWLFLAFIAAPVHPQGIPPGGTSVLPAGEFSGFTMGGPNDFGSTETVAVAGMPFTQALRSIGKPGAKDPWSFQLDVRTAAPVERGDVLLATFWLRCLSSRQESGAGRTAFIFQLNGAPWTDVIDQGAAAGQDWQQFFIPFESTASFPAGGAVAAFRLGYEPQTLEFADMQLINYGKSRKVSDLPLTRVTYEGMEPEAPWRAEAEARIRALRMAELTVNVVDGAGKPVPGATVQVLQTRSAFQWGTAINEKRLTEVYVAEGSDTAKYRATLKSAFNSAVLENGLKAPPLHGDWGKDWGWDVAVGSVNWLRDAGLLVRGHVLVWPGWKNLPKSWKGLADSPKALKETILEHIANTAGGMVDSLQQWDVVNEPYANDDVTKILGEVSLAEWFKAAKQADPKAQLFLNDFGILEGGSGDNGHRQHYEKTIRTLLAQRAPLEGLGMQGHFGAGLTAPRELKKILDRYAQFGLPILVTEYDILIKDEALAGDYTRDFLTLMYSHPSMQGVLLWGFWDGAHPSDNAALFRKDWTLKPAGQVWRDLVLGKWKTRATRSSDALGQVKVQGHLGDYEVLVRKDGREVKKKAALTKGGAALKVTM